MENGEQLLPTGTEVPNHLVIIPDGNRRWAKNRGLPTFEGHRVGFQLTPKIARASRDFGINTLTIWAFSTENWKRTDAEITYLMRMYDWFIGHHLKEAKRDGVRIIHLGRKDRIPQFLRKKIEKAEKETAGNVNNILNIALDYGGRDELLRATKKMLEEKTDPEDLNEETFASFLDTKRQPYPYPDLLIRTSGEERISGIFPWQSAYTEFYFVEEHFPDFSVKKLREAILEYSNRVRRFGGDQKEQEKHQKGEYEIATNS